MKEKKKRKEKNPVFPADLAWNNFKKTGLISYYLLYKKLDKSDIDGKDF